MVIVRGKRNVVLYNPLLQSAVFVVRLCFVSRLVERRVHRSVAVVAARWKQDLNADNLALGFHWSARGIAHLTLAPDATRQCIIGLRTCAE